MVSFGMVNYFTEFMQYGGGTKSFFDLVYDVFYDTILPLNGLIICLFVAFRWKKHNMDKELLEGDPGYANSLTKKYVDFSLTTFIPVILLFIFINAVCLKYFSFSLIDF